MTLEEIIMDLTARTANGGHFWIGSNYIIVRHGLDRWEWVYRGRSFYDLADLAENIIWRNSSTSRLVRFFSGRVPDERRVARA